MKTLAIIFSLAAFFSTTASSQSTLQNEGKYSAAGLDDDIEVEKFFVSFKEAVAKGEK